jgi:hypothetical protein
MAEQAKLSEERLELIRRFMGEPPSEPEPDEPDEPEKPADEPAPPPARANPPRQTRARSTSPPAREAPQQARARSAPPRPRARATAPELPADSVRVPAARKPAGLLAAQTPDRARVLWHRLELKWPLLVVLIGVVLGVLIAR